MIGLPTLAYGLGGAGLAWVGYKLLSRDPLAQFDLPLGHLASVDSPEAKLKSEQALDNITQRLRSTPASSSKLSIKRRVPLMREAMEGFFAEEEKRAVSSFTPVDADAVPAEWVVAPEVDADNNRRLMYIHGGAFFAGSPKSHRVITSKLSEVTNSSVLAIDYRLMPEFSRRDCVEDCATAYQWMLGNGSQGPGQADNILVAGDSAGGNLTLVLMALLRDTGGRAANAAVCLSPVTDCRFASPSIFSNLSTDVMLKPLASRITRVPKVLLRLAARHLAKDNPSDPLISPLLGDLSDLPPTLVLASQHEILRDDGRRYVNKAVAAGSAAEFVYCMQMPHVWPIFYPELPEAELAFQQISEFLDRHN